MHATADTADLPIREETTAAVLEVVRLAEGVTTRHPLVGRRLVLGRSGDVDIRCPNTRSCPAQLRERVFHVGSRGALDVEGLGWKAGIALLESGAVRDEGDVFGLDAATLRTIPFFTRAAKPGEAGPQLTANAEALLVQLGKEKSQPLWRVLVALSIRHVGPSSFFDSPHSPSAVQESLRSAHAQRALAM